MKAWTIWRLAYRPAWTRWSDDLGIRPTWCARAGAYRHLRGPWWWRIGRREPPARRTGQGGHAVVYTTREYAGRVEIVDLHPEVIDPPPTDPVARKVIRDLERDMEAKLARLIEQAGTRTPYEGTTPWNCRNRANPATTGNQGSPPPPPSISPPPTPAPEPPLLPPRS